MLINDMKYQLIFLDFSEKLKLHLINSDFILITLLPNISREALTIWGYVFMEMMNNAIEHSLSENIYCYVVRDYLYTEISIADDGIGGRLL